MNLAVDRYDELEKSYLNDSTGAASIHALVSTVDFQLRFVTLCAAAALREMDPYQVELSRCPGFGGYQAFLHRAISLLRRSDEVAAAAVDLAEGALASVKAFSGKDTAFGTFEKLRNHLFHVGLMPSGSAAGALRTHVESVVQSSSTVIRRFLGDAVVEVTPDDSELNVVTFAWKSSRLTTWPFICMDNSGKLCIFSQFNSLAPSYFRSGQQEVSLKGRSDELIIALNDSMIAIAKDKNFPYFIGDIRRDLEGFRDPDHAVHYYELDGAVTMVWSRAVSSGVERRDDRFRIGHGEQRQWWDPEKNKWRPYPDFLRHIVNWPIAAARFRQYLKGVEDDLVSEEREYLASTQESSLYVEPFLRVSGLDKVAGKAKYMTFSELGREIDDRLGNRGSKTRIYFIEGEAGIGKTRSLVAAALARARAIEREGDTVTSQDRLPLLYYVRSTGQASNSLDTVINAAATKTKNLELENIKALCRNGLIALVIDGFDELLGGVGYDNALGSLQQWIEAMAGRGVIMLSARSSYYVNQYSASIRRNRERLDIVVEHRVATFKEWNDDQLTQFLHQYGVDPNRLHELSPEDRALLGLPFFARIYAESADIFDPSTDTLPDLLLQQYIAREAPKLVDGQNRPLLDPDQLRRTFENLAVAMADQGAREADVGDLERAALGATGLQDISLIPGLRDRLSTLCALKVSAAAAVNVRFAFQHELFFDIFLADAILRALAASDFERVILTMARVEWRTATVTRVTRKGGEEVELLLAATAADIPDEPERMAATFRANLGSLWEFHIRSRGVATDAEIVAATFKELDLNGVSIGKATFVDCDFGDLRLPSSGPGDLRFSACTIETLWVNSEDSPLRAVSVFEQTAVSQLVRPSSYLDKPHEVQQALHELGAPVPGAETLDTRSMFEDAVEYFLENIAYRVDSVVVYEQNLAPADDKPRWQHEYGPDAWIDFIRILRETGCAKLVPFSAGGKAVLRVRINGLDKLRKRVLADEAVAKFWSRVGNS
ncbi:hypothetical protein Q5425_37125 [Amycolatopsis sp. A133]|uniref:hypothetical protein n=1 Tax=Amycolatopsis sp. A133 TaxID=3064472 RepID=UPI0027F704BA|nr:hypothetical protein [Amycolatopsis sp. A133]MDQ7809381.1 hypothetical protein [Amycolatopsis sp. A133]